MAAWGTDDMSAALPVVETSIGEAPAAAPAPFIVPTAKLSGQTPQEYGWVSKTVYNYETYLKSPKELADTQATAIATEEVEDAVGGVRAGDWANNAAIYTWDDEYGDVGPAFPELERQLFGSEYHVKTGVAFEK